MDAQYKVRLHSPKKSASPKASIDSYDGARRKLNFNKDIFYDRSIPSTTVVELEASFALLPSQEQVADKSPAEINSPAHALYKQVLQNELLGTQNSSDSWSLSKLSFGSPRNASFGSSDSPTNSPTRLFSYKRSPQTSPTTAENPSFSLSPIGMRSQQLLSTPTKPIRKIPKIPFKVLEAPQIQDDFYLNLVDWSSQNLLAVGLNHSVYLWNALTSQVIRLYDGGTGLETVTSLSWMGKGTHLAIGSSSGTVALWDVVKQKKIRTFLGHKTRVGVMAWCQSPQWLLSSGSRDRTILHRDVRTCKDFVGKFLGHKQEVCGLKWGYNPCNMLASGGNDNKLLLWDLRVSDLSSDGLAAESGTVGSGGIHTQAQPVYRCTSHTAAVKGLTWSPHQRGLLASGGGTADQRIRFWNTSTGQEIHSVDTGSQVCNLAWSKNVNELVSTHGYSQNQIIVWSYPSMRQLTTLTGHSMRVLYLACSPDGQTIVTGAGDETLRFWSIFPKAKTSTNSSRNSLDFGGSLSSNEIR